LDWRVAALALLSGAVLGIIGLYISASTPIAAASNMTTRPATAAAKARRGGANQRSSQRNASGMPQLQ
jgi:hypothetical protein